MKSFIKEQKQGECDYECFRFIRLFLLQTVVRERF